MNRLSQFLLFIFLSLLCHAANAQVSHYPGIDRVSSPSIATATNALAAEANWLNDASAAGTIYTVDFESMTPGATGSSFVIAPGVTMTAVGSLQFPSTLEVRSGPMPLYPLTHGFNTTTGGANHMRYYQSPGNLAQPAVLLTFSQPICAFSTFVTGGQENPGLISDFFVSQIKDSFTSVVSGFGDAGNPYWPSTQQPNVRYGGFIDPAGSYTSLYVAFRFDSAESPYEASFSLDDIRWVYANHIPEPSTLALLAFPTLIVAGRRRGHSVLQI